MSRFIDLTGQKFNRLTVLGLGERNSSGQMQWKCKCECGNIAYATTTYLKTGHTKSCGCLKKENMLKKAKSPEFISAKNKYRKEHFLKDGTSLALINPRRIRRNNSTGVTGVYYNKSLKKYIARIHFRGKNISLGCYYKLEDAKKARELAEEKYFKPILDKYKEEH